MRRLVTRELRSHTFYRKCVQTMTTKMLHWKRSWTWQPAPGSTGTGSCWTGTISSASSPWSGWTPASSVSNQNMSLKISPFDLSLLTCYSIPVTRLNRTTWQSWDISKFSSFFYWVDGLSLKNYFGFSSDTGTQDKRWAGVWHGVSFLYNKNLSINGLFSALKYLWTPPRIIWLRVEMTRKLATCWPLEQVLLVR